MLRPWAGERERRLGQTPAAFGAHVRIDLGVLEVLDAAGPGELVDVGSDPQQHSPDATEARTGFRCGSEAACKLWQFRTIGLASGRDRFLLVGLPVATLAGVAPAGARESDAGRRPGRCEAVASWSTVCVVVGVHACSGVTRVRRWRLGRLCVWSSSWRASR